MENILEYLENNRLSELKNILNEENPVDIAEHFEDLSKEKTILVFRILQKDAASEVFSYLSVEFTKTWSDDVGSVALVVSRLSSVKVKLAGAGPLIVRVP